MRFLAKDAGGMIVDKVAKVTRTSRPYIGTPTIHGYIACIMLCSRRSAVWKIAAIVLAAAGNMH